MLMATDFYPTYLYATTRTKMDLEPRKDKVKGRK